MPAKKKTTTKNTSAEKRESESKTTEDKKSSVDISETLRSIKTKFGDEAIMTLTDTKKVDVDTIPTGSIGLDDALGIARANAKQHGLENIECIKSDWCHSLQDRMFDAVVSNPPYIAKNDVHLKQGDLRFEPQRALISGDTGMDDIRKIVSQSKNHLNDEGWLVLEHGYDQKASVFDCLDSAGFININQKNDLSGNPRISSGQYKR